MLESYFSLLVKLAAMASIASVLARSNSFKSLLMGETRTLNQRVALSLWLASAFGVSVAIRVFSKSYPAADLGSGRQLDRGHPGRLCHRTRLRSADLLAGHAQSFGRRTDDHAAAGRGGRARRRAARSGAGYGRDLAIHPVLRSERLPLFQGEPESPAHGISPGIHGGDSGGGVSAPVAGWLEGLFHERRPAAICRR